ncbi:MAG TPA: hypothetical protein VGL70_21645 [Candidatus Binatia bacterium]|jgi:hypothetical protein
MLKTYTHDEMRQIHFAYLGGDGEAGVLEDQFIRQFMEQRGERDYKKGRDGFHKFMTERPARQASDAKPVTEQKKYEAGVELDAVAKDLMKTRRVGYTAALKMAIVANPKLGAAYLGCDVSEIRTDGFEAVYGEALRSRNYGAIQNLGAIISALPKKSDGSVDAPQAVSTLANHVQLIRDAASEFIEAETQKRANRLSGGASGSPLTSENIERARAEIEKEFRPVVVARDSGRMTEAALRMMYGQFFK